MIAKPRGLSLEGYLAPDTYRVYADATVKNIISRLASQREKEFSAELQNSIKLPKKEIAEKLLLIFHLDNVTIEQKYLLNTIFEDYTDKNISLTDAYNAALMQKKKIKQIYSFDEDFDKFPQVNRLEK